MYSYHIWRTWYNGSNIMMAKPIRVLELQYSITNYMYIRLNWLSLCLSTLKLSTWVFLLTLRMLKRVERLVGSNPDSLQCSWYSRISRDATTVLTTLGISIVWPSDSFRFLVPYATSWRNDGLEIKSKKWSTLTGSRRHRCKTGGSITWPGLLRFASFLASSILHLLNPES